MCTSRLLVLAVFVAGGIECHSNAFAVSLVPNDIVASVNAGTQAQPEPALMLIDPVSGDRTIISDDSVGSGPSFLPTLPVGDTISVLIPSISLQADGSLLVTAEGEISQPSGPLLNYGRVFRVDPASGDRTIVSDLSTNSGPSSFYYGAAESGANITLSGSAGLLSIDPATGDRSLLSGTSVGTGPDIKQSTGFVQSGSTFFVADEVGNQIMQVNALNGNRTVVSSASIGTGPSLNGPAGVALDGAGNLLVSTSAGSILSVSLSSGNRSTIASTTVGSGIGPSVIGEFGLATSGAIIGADYTDNAILSIDPTTGNRMVLSDATHGLGPGLFQPFSLTVVASVPEPSTSVLVLMGASLLAGFWRLRRLFAQR